MLWEVNVSILVDAHNNEEAMDRVDSFLRRDGRNKDLDFNFMAYSVYSCDDFQNLKELRSVRKQKG